ncbi:MAG: NADH:ubiquinone reductase (Na(+)-transporting) subunit A [Acidobacteria bacterium]|nr:MAG: NADH:ubiquinone reductase (Na(+)-transporting) subunit A [Acidobacteriota bacterium]
MATYHIKKGYNVPMKGAPAKKKEVLPVPKTLGICPTDFQGIKPKLTVKLNDKVKIGSPLFFDKRNPEVQFVSPCAGCVSAIHYGARRKILDIAITLDEEEEAIDFKSFTEKALTNASAEDIKEVMLKAGLWPFIRQRPYNCIAHHEDKPKAVFVNCMDTAPLACDPVYSLSEEGEAFALGIEILKKLAGDNIHVVTSPQGKASFSNARGVHLHEFTGKHPAGLVGTHIAKIDPINKGETVWVINARDTVTIGQFFQTGSFPTKRIIAVTGNGIKEQKYLEVRTGAKLEDILKGNLQEGTQRVISGNPLTGVQRSKDSFLGVYDSSVTVIPEPTGKKFIGWMLPGFNRPSYTRTFLSRLIPGKLFSYDTNLNGGQRTMVQSGLFENLVALDVHPEFLVKAILAGDIELMEKLGILECDEEDFALCSYVSPSKIEISSIIRDGLELMEKDG